MTHPDSAPSPTSAPSPSSTFVVERYWPGVTRPALDAAVDRIRASLTEGFDDGEAVDHVATLLVDADEVVFCFFSAASRAAVEAVNARADFPFDRIVQGTWLSSVARDEGADRRARSGRRTRGALAGLGVACALLIGACSGGAPPPSVAGPVAGGTGSAPGGAAPSPATVAGGSQAAIDQCSLLTSAEIEAVTGLKVVGSGPDARGIDRCVWTLSGEGRNEIGVSVDLDSPRAQKDQEFECKVGFGLKPLAGVGDTACGDTVTGGEYQLSALQGNNRIRLRISEGLNYNRSIKKTAWATLAQDVLGKLP